MDCVWVRSPEPEKWRARLPGLGRRWAMRSWRAGRSATRAGSCTSRRRSGDASRTAIVPPSNRRTAGYRWPRPNSPPPHRTRRRGARRSGNWWIDSLARARGLPVVVLGDMNAEPDSDEIRLLCGHKTAPAREGFVLVDAWRYAAEGPIRGHGIERTPTCSPPWSRAPGSTTCSWGRLRPVGAVMSARFAGSAPHPCAACGPRIMRVSSPSWRPGRRVSRPPYQRYRTNPLECLRDKANRRHL